MAVGRPEPAYDRAGFKKDSDRSDHVTFPRLPLSNKIPFTALYPLLLRPDAVLM